MTTATTALRTLFVRLRAVFESPRTPPAAALLDRLPGALDDVVVALEEAEPAAAARDVVDVARHGVGEVVHLAHERRHERRRDPDDEEDRADEDDPDRGAALEAAVDEELDGRVERHREEEGDQHPDDHGARHPDDLEHDRDGEQDADHAEDRARAEADEALVGHGARIGVGLDGPRACAGSRRSRAGPLEYRQRGCSSMVELQPSKLAMRVRFPPPALSLTRSSLRVPLLSRP